MFKITQPFLAAVAAAMSLILALGLLVLDANALAIVVLSPPAPAQSMPVLPPEKLAAISNRDVIVFIDSSRSMSRSIDPSGHLPGRRRNAEADGPPAPSRWQWCSEQTEHLSHDLHNTLKDHLKVVLFSDNYKVYKDVDLTSVPAFFARNKPYGNTNATKALRSQLHAYFAARDSAAGSQKPRPLLVAMITDGCPDEPMLLRQTIIDATKKMHSADEIAITFLQVGVDPSATKYLRELDDCLVGDKARFDIVSARSFEQLNRSGLSMALLDAVN